MTHLSLRPSLPLPQPAPRAPRAALRRAFSRVAVASALGLAGLGAWAQPPARPPSTSPGRRRLPRRRRELRGPDPRPGQRPR
jgi:hypothetical protein